MCGEGAGSETRVSVSCGKISSGMFPAKGMLDREGVVCRRRGGMEMNVASRTYAGS